MSYLRFFTKPIDETIRQRVASRTYKDRMLTENHKKQLLDFCAQIKEGLWGEKIEYQLVEFSTEELKGKRIASYGLFTNARNFLVGMIDRTDSNRISYGYAMEHTVLKATEMGIGTCWLGYFDPYLIQRVRVKDNQEIPAVILIGYAAEKRALIEKLARFAVRAAKRLEWSKLFFHVDFRKTLSREAAGPYAAALELLRLAPSAGNTQPWRIVKDKSRNIFHFFKKVVNPGYEKKKLHDIDIGIAMCHFELGADQSGQHGYWMQKDPQIGALPTKIHYMVTWMHETMDAKSKGHGA